MKKVKERSTWSHITADVLPPIRLKHPLKLISRQQPQQADGTADSSLCGHHGHKPIPCRLPPLDQYSSQAVQDIDGINNNTSEVSFDLHYGFETECDADTIAEHERPKAPEPMILESLSNYDLSELLGKDEEPECIPVAPTEAPNCKPQAIRVCTASSNTISKKISSNMGDYLVLEDVDESDYIDGQIFTTASSNNITQAMSQEPLLDYSLESQHLAQAATVVSEKSIKSTKASSRSQSSRLRRIASNITRAVSNKFRKLCRPAARVEGSSMAGGKSGEENENGVIMISSSASTQNLLHISS